MSLGTKPRFISSPKKGPGTRPEAPEDRKAPAEKTEPEEAVRLAENRGLVDGAARKDG